MQGRKQAGDGVGATLLARLSPRHDGRDLGGIATYRVEFAPGSQLEIPGPDEAEPAVTLYGVTAGTLEIVLLEGTGYYHAADGRGEEGERPMEVGVPVVIGAGGYASLQSRHRAVGGNDGGQATVTTQGGRCKICPSRG